MYARIAFLFIFSAFAMTLRGQFPAVRNFSAADYDGGTQNWCTAETSLKYIIVANNTGLMAFNGTSWDHTHVPNYTNVHAVAVDEARERIYVGAFEEFGYFENVDPLRAAPYVSLSRLLPDEERHFHDIWSIVHLADGKLAFSSNYRVFIYDPADSSIKILRFTAKITNTTELSGRLYISTLSHISEYDGSRLRILPGSEDIGTRNVAGAFLDRGKVVFATRSHGFYTYTSGKFAQYHIAGLSEFTAGKRIFCTAANESMIVLGTVSHGVAILDRETKKVCHLDRTTGLRNNTVLSLMIDADNNVWACLDNGLSYIIFDSPFRSIFTAETSVGTGYASASLDDRLYIGTNQGLYHIALPQNHSDSPFTPVEVRGVSGQIWGLAEFDGTILCGADAGAFAVEGDVATRLDVPYGTWGFRALPGRPGYIIASLYEGFAVLHRNGSTFETIGVVKGIDVGTCNFEVDADGSIWVSHWLQGVYHFSLSPDLRSVDRKEVYNAGNQLPADDNNLVAKINGKIYISSADGIHTTAGFGGRLGDATELNRVWPPEGIALRLIETPSGDLWASRPNFLSYARHTAGGYAAREIHYLSTVKRLQVILGNFSFLPDGRTVMNQDEGFYVVDSDYTRPGSRQVCIDIIRSMASKKDGSEQFLYNKSEEDKIVEIKREDNSIYFEYSTAQYRDAGAVLFSTMLSGHESEWTPPSALNYREITNLPPGSYTFCVRALDTITGETSTDEVRFRISPAWYETWWMRAIFIIVGCLLIYVIIDRCKRVVKHIIERRHKETQEKDRLNLEIKRKSSELADSDINMQRKNDILNDVNARLSEILRTSSPSDSPAAILDKIREVRQSLRFHSSTDFNWQRLEENFNIVFDNLLQELIHRYPSLTRNDIKLCSYLKMNLSTKEIATLLNVSERSVESNRYRLRKKLGLPTGQSFIDFFNSIS